jgi:peroxiredoxin
MVARAGTLDPGEPAPDFELPLEDGSAKVRLSAHRGVRPVMLIFGSYT